MSVDAVLLVSVDTLRADRLGAYGGSVGTPRLDALAARSVVFDAAWTTAPITLPAHASLLTGLYPFRHGVRANGSHRLPDEIPLLAERMRGAGFATAAFIGGFPLDRRFGLARGFDHYDDELPRAGGGFHYPERRGDEVAQRALAWLGARPRSERAFVFVHLYDPHADYAAPSRHGARFAERPYDGEVAFVDEVVGALLDGVARLRSNRIVVFTSDHGESLGEQGEATHGMLLHEAVLRVPLMIQAPGLEARRVAEPVSLVDVVPTLLSLLRAVALVGIDGRDLLPAPSAARDLYAETLLPFFDHGWSALRALRRASMKFVESSEPELYDLAADPGESRSLLPATNGESYRRALAAVPLHARAAAATTLDAAARARLESLGYAASSSAPATDMFSGRPAPRSRIGLVAALDEIASLPPEAARPRLEEIARREPGSNLVQRRLAATYMRLGRYDAAVEAYRVARRNGYVGDDLAEALALAHSRAGEARASRGDLAAARSAFEEARRLTPSSPEPIHALGVLEARAGRFEKAFALFREAQGADPGFAPAWFSAGHALERLGRAEEAREAYQRFLATDPGASRERDHAERALRR